jgi:hypothetical protein
MLKLLPLLALAAAGSLYAQSPDFELSIAIPKIRTNGPGSEAHAVTYDKSDKRPFYVVLTNKTASPQHLWEEWNSWGFYNLYFEMTDSTNKTWLVKRSYDRAFMVNAPGWFNLDPGEVHVFSVTFPNDWQDLPPARVEDHHAVVMLRAIYEIPPDPMIQNMKTGAWRMDTKVKENGVWTGKVISNPVNVELFEDSVQK